MSRTTDSSTRLTDHDAIRRWAEERGGRPAQVTRTGRNDDPGILRLYFGESDSFREAIDWDAFFAKFDAAELALLVEDDGSDPAGKKAAKSQFNKLIHRHTS